jgi:hypothetical protein
MKKFINTGLFQCSYNVEFFLAEKENGFIKLSIEDPEFIIEATNFSIEESEEVIQLLKQNIDIILSNIAVTAK